MTVIFIGTDCRYAGILETGSLVDRYQCDIFITSWLHSFVHVLYYFRAEW